MKKHLVVGCLSLAFAGSVVQVAPVAASATARKQTVAVKVTGCDMPEEEDTEGIDYEYLADETVGPCTLTATIKPKTPKRTLVLQKWDEESESWKDVAKKATNTKGVASIKVPDTFDKECLSYDSFKFRVISLKTKKNSAITGKALTIAFVSDPDSKPCLTTYGEDEPSDKADDDFSVDD